jgi:SAM-dependent methyltransferase
MSDDPNRTVRFFDSYADEFDALYGTPRNVISRIINPIFRRSMRLRFERTMQECVPLDSATVLDVGCGPGHYAVELAKSGAAEVIGIDFSQTMIDLARRNAAKENLENRCRFQCADFLLFQAEKKFDFVILMGLMDYVADARSIVEKAVSLATRKALFSFPDAKGVLAWQRRIRYKNRCALYMYDRDETERLFAGLPGVKVDIAKLSRDFYVTVTHQAI